MVEEGTRFQDLAHPNIYPLIGIVDGDGGRPLLVYPAVSHGNLKRSAVAHHCAMSILFYLMLCF